MIVYLNYIIQHLFYILFILQVIKYMYTLDNFYTSIEWRTLRKLIIDERTQPDGFIYDEVTGKPILKPYDIILHHKQYLTNENVNDFSISLNPNNIQIVSHITHNRIHEKFGYIRREIYLVYGSPLAGVRDYVDSVRLVGDLIVDIDSIWECVSGCEKFFKPPTLNTIVFGIRDNLIDCVRVRKGKWINAYICGGYPLISERERLCKQLGAREIYIESTKEECLKRLEQSTTIPNKKEFQQYIEEWWARYTPKIV